MAGSRQLSKAASVDSPENYVPAHPVADEQRMGRSLRLAAYSNSTTQEYLQEQEFATVVAMLVRCTAPSGSKSGPQLNNYSHAPPAAEK